MFQLATHMPSGDQLIFAGFAISGAAFVAVLLLYIRQRHHVSKEKLHAVEDVSQLWKYGVPPKIALNPKGLKLRRYAYLAIPVLFTAAAIIAAKSSFGTFSGEILFAIVIGSILIATIFESRLKRHVSRENVCAVEDPSRLWRFGGPPKAVLNENGVRLYRYMYMSVTAFFLGIGIVFFGAIFGNGLVDLSEFG